MSKPRPGRKGKPKTATEGSQFLRDDPIRDRLVEIMCGLVEPLGGALPRTSEVVLHDLSRLPNSIVAVHGSITGRQVGDPATDVLLGMVASGDFASKAGYEARLPDGRKLRSSTTIIPDLDGNPIAALCINTDISSWEAMRDLSLAMLGESVATAAAGDVAQPPPESSEVFMRDLNELANHLVDQAIAKTGVAIDLMHKRHKLAVVRELMARGFFLIKDSIDLVAMKLNVTRFTIYNYLNEIGTESADNVDEPSAG